MKIITGNDLKTGLVIWWDGQGWSVHVEDAFDVGDQGEQILAIETAACRVNGGYVLDADDGLVQPAAADVGELDGPGRECRREATERAGCDTGGEREAKRIAP